jgi:predicted AAA+ superfamily ATPase
LAAQATNDPSGFFARCPTPALIDEVQYAPELFRHLKTVVDQKRELSGQFILTGSQKFALMKGVSESLAGRVAILELETLSAKEVSAQEPNAVDSQGWSERLARGGYPALWNDPEFPLDMFFSSYLTTYLERDLRQQLNVSSLRHFERFLRACAARNAQLLDKSQLAVDVGVSAPTITQWINVLQASNQVYLLEPWFVNTTKRIVKSPKLYFADTGLLCYLLGLTPTTLVDSPFVGAVWEAYVYAELRKQLARGNATNTLWFYRDKQQLEVDFMLTGGGKARLIECKWTEIPDFYDAKNLVRLTEILAQSDSNEVRHCERFVVCRTPRAFPLGSAAQALNLLELGTLFP